MSSKRLGGVSLVNRKFYNIYSGDSEGYVTFECPYCNSEFKLQAGEYQNDDEPFEELFCPYCGLAKEKNEFLSAEVIEQAQAIAYNYMVEELKKTFKKNAKVA